MFIVNDCRRLLCLTLFMVILFTANQAFPDSDRGIIFQNNRISLEIEPEHGTISRIVDKASGIELSSQSELAENFRLLVVMPDKKNTVIMGKNQKLSDTRADGSILTLRWNGPLKDEEGKTYDIPVRMEIKADGSSLTFQLFLQNKTKDMIQEVWYPFIGGLAGFTSSGGQPNADIWAPTSSPFTKKIELPFGKIALGYPGHMNMSFICVRNAKINRSLYISSQDSVARYKTYNFAEVGDGIKDVVTYIQHMPFTKPGKSFAGSPIVYRFIDGDWRIAGRVYREWFKKTFGIADLDSCWIRKHSFFQMTMFMLPEGTINYTFKDIPRWAKDAKDHGVNAVMISGWQRGGHDNGYPYYEPDPRLGTWEDLRKGIQACHKMGIKVFFFVNYQPMMVDSDWYKNELKKYLEVNANGKPTWLAGWGMGTLYARMGHPKLMSWADLAFPQFRKIIVDYFSKLAQIGADGVHVDKMFPAAIDYNPDIPASPDTATWEGSVQLTREIFKECRKYNPDWAMSFECNWDRMLEFTNATWWVGNMRIVRSVFPEHVETLGLANAFDYLGVNNAVRSGHVVQVCPLNFTRSMGWAPWSGLSDYIKEVKRIQDGLQDTVFLGEVLGHEQVLLREISPGVEYNAFRNLKTGKRACIFTSNTMEVRNQKFKGFTGNITGKVRIHTPFRKPITVKLPAEVEIPGEQIVFVEEM